MWTYKAAAAALLVTAAAAAHAFQAPGAAPKNLVPTPTEKTMANQPLDIPPGPLELTISSLDLPAGAPIPVHMHFWSRYVYLERGTVQVTILATGSTPAKTRLFTAGQVIVEPIGLWHKGCVFSTGPARLIVIDQTPPGRSNHIVPPPPPAPPAPPAPCPPGN
jgi:quercetin dioxygenase-like cupin family protein